MASAFGSQKLSSAEYQMQKNRALDDLGVPASNREAVLDQATRFSHVLEDTIIVYDQQAADDAAKLESLGFSGPGTTLAFSSETANHYKGRSLNDWNRQFTELASSSTPPPAQEGQTGAAVTPERTSAQPGSHPSLPPASSTDAVSGSPSPSTEISVLTLPSAEEIYAAAYSGSKKAPIAPVPFDIFQAMWRNYVQLVVAGERVTSQKLTDAGHQHRRDKFREGLANLSQPLSEDHFIALIRYSSHAPTGLPLAEIMAEDLLIAFEWVHQREGGTRVLTREAEFAQDIEAYAAILRKPEDQIETYGGKLRTKDLNETWKAAAPSNRRARFVKALGALGMTEEAFIERVKQVLRGEIQPLPDKGKGDGPAAPSDDTDRLPSGLGAAGGQIGDGKPGGKTEGGEPTGRSGAGVISDPAGAGDIVGAGLVGGRPKGIVELDEREPRQGTLGERVSTAPLFTPVGEPKVGDLGLYVTYQVRLNRAANLKDFLDALREFQKTQESPVMIRTLQVSRIGVGVGDREPRRGGHYRIGRAPAYDLSTPLQENEVINLTFFAGGSVRTEEAVQAGLRPSAGSLFEFVERLESQHDDKHFAYFTIRMLRDVHVGGLLPALKGYLQSQSPYRGQLRRLFDDQGNEFPFFENTDRYHFDHELDESDIVIVEVYSDQPFEDGAAPPAKQRDQRSPSVKVNVGNAKQRLQKAEKDEITRRLKAGIEKRMQKTPVNRILYDLGAGKGEITGGIGPLFGKVVAVEKDEPNVNALMGIGNPFMEVVEGDFFEFIARMHREKKRADVILMSHSLSLYFAEDQRDTLLEQLMDLTDNLVLVLNSNEAIPGSNVDIRKRFMKRHDVVEEDRKENMEHVLREMGFGVEVERVSIFHETSNPDEIKRLALAMLPQVDRDNAGIQQEVGAYVEKDRPEGLKIPGSKRYKLTSEQQILWVSNIPGATRRRRGRSALVEEGEDLDFFQIQERLWERRKDKEALTIDRRRQVVIGLSEDPLTYRNPVYALVTYAGMKDGMARFAIKYPGPFFRSAIMDQKTNEQVRETDFKGLIPLEPGKQYFTLEWNRNEPPSTLFRVSIFVSKASFDKASLVLIADEPTVVFKTQDLMKLEKFQDRPGHIVPIDANTRNYDSFTLDGIENIDDWNIKAGRNSDGIFVPRKFQRRSEMRKPRSRLDRISDSLKSGLKDLVNTGILMGQPFVSNEKQRIFVRIEQDGKLKILGKRADKSHNDLYGILTGFNIVSELMSRPDIDLSSIEIEFSQVSKKTTYESQVGDMAALLRDVFLRESKGQRSHFGLTGHGFYDLAEVAEPTGKQRAIRFVLRHVEPAIDLSHVPEVRDVLENFLYHHKGSLAGSPLRNPERARTLRFVNRFTKARDDKNSPLLRLAQALEEGSFSPAKSQEWIARAIELLEHPAYSAADLDQSEKGRKAMYDGIQFLRKHLWEQPDAPLIFPNPEMVAVFEDAARYMSGSVQSKYYRSLIHKLRTGELDKHSATDRILMEHVFRRLLMDNKDEIKEALRQSVFELVEAYQKVRAKAGFRADSMGPDFEFVLDYRGGIRLIVLSGGNSIFAEAEADEAANFMDREFVNMREIRFRFRDYVFLSKPIKIDDPVIRRAANVVTDYLFYWASQNLREINLIPGLERLPSKEFYEVQYLEAASDYAPPKLPPTKHQLLLGVPGKRSEARTNDTAVPVATPAEQAVKSVPEILEEVANELKVYGDDYGRGKTLQMGMMLSHSVLKTEVPLHPAIQNVMISPRKIYEQAPLFHEDMDAAAVLLMQKGISQSVIKLVQIPLNWTTGTQRHAMVQYHAAAFLLRIESPSGAYFFNLNPILEPFFTVAGVVHPFLPVNQTKFPSKIINAKKEMPYVRNVPSNYQWLSFDDETGKLSLTLNQPEGKESVPVGVQPFDMGGDHAVRYLANGYTVYVGVRPSQDRSDIEFRYRIVKREWSDNNRKFSEKTAVFYQLTVPLGVLKKAGEDFAGISLDDFGKNFLPDVPTFAPWANKVRFNRFAYDPELQKAVFDNLEDYYYFISNFLQTEENTTGKIFDQFLKWQSKLDPMSVIGETRLVDIHENWPAPPTLVLPPEIRRYASHHHHDHHHTKYGDDHHDPILHRIPLVTGHGGDPAAVIGLARRVFVADLGFHFNGVEGRQVLFALSPDKTGNFYVELDAETQSTRDQWKRVIVPPSGIVILPLLGGRRFRLLEHDREGVTNLVWLIPSKVSLDEIFFEVKRSKRAVAALSAQVLSSYEEANVPQDEHGKEGHRLLLQFMRKPKDLLKLVSPAFLEALAGYLAVEKPTKRSEVRSVQTHVAMNSIYPDRAERMGRRWFLRMVPVNVLDEMLSKLQSGQLQAGPVLRWFSGFTGGMPDAYASDVLTDVIVTPVSVLDSATSTISDGFVGSWIANRDFSATNSALFLDSDWTRFLTEPDDARSLYLLLEAAEKIQKQSKTHTPVFALEGNPENVWNAVREALTNQRNQLSIQQRVDAAKFLDEGRLKSLVDVISAQQASASGLNPWIDSRQGGVATLHSRAKNYFGRLKTPANFILNPRDMHAHDRPLAGFFILRMLDLARLVHEIKDPEGQIRLIQTYFPQTQHTSNAFELTVEEALTQTLNALEQIDSAA